MLYPDAVRSAKVRNHILYPEKLSAEEIRHRIDHYWRPYHQRLGELIEERRRAAGTAFHLSCHCMGSIGHARQGDEGQKRADFCLSNRDGKTSSKEFIEIVAEALRRRGFSVSFNAPFKGAECVKRHGRPEKNVHSVQVETIKGLFMEEESFRRKPDFDRVKKELGGVAAEISDYARSNSKQL